MTFCSERTRQGRARRKNRVGQQDSDGTGGSPWQLAASGCKRLAHACPVTSPPKPTGLSLSTTPSSRSMG